MTGTPLARVWRELTAAGCVGRYVPGRGGADAEEDTEAFAAARVGRAGEVGAVAEATPGGGKRRSNEPRGSKVRKKGGSVAASRAGGAEAYEMWLRSHVCSVSETEVNAQLGELTLNQHSMTCLLYTSPSPRDQRGSRMPSSA